MKNSHRELSNLRAAIAADVLAAMDHSHNTTDRSGLISLPLVDSASWARSKNILRSSDSNIGGTPENRQSSAHAFRQSWNHRS